MARGRIQKALSGFYYVDTGESEPLRCRARGKFRQDGLSPLVGDWVEVRETEPGAGIVWEVEPRRNDFVRPAAANVDQLVVVASRAIPVTDPFLIDRVAAVAALKSCDVVVCINKTDLVPGGDLAELYRRAGFAVVETSAVTGEGLEELKEILAGKLSAFTGNSGAGKSSLLNAIEPNFSLQVGEV
ncbi:MAG: ribosome small subunit-dependent GTPase A, partial [Oscillospiraceae bacterium]|nr:ribosome small subunit-dependent GTPase A [Oscillospiraceae bacterium]